MNLNPALALIYLVDSNPLTGVALVRELADETLAKVEVFETIDQVRSACSERAPQAVIVRLRPSTLGSLTLFSEPFPNQPAVLVLAEDEAQRQVASGHLGPLRVAASFEPFEFLPKLRAALAEQALRRDLASARAEIAERDQALSASKQHAAQTSAELSAKDTVLETATRRLVEAEQLAAVGRVVTGIAHEISNQLALVGYAEAIKSRVDPASELYEFADAIAVAQRRLATMVDQVRSFTGAEPDSTIAEPASLAAVVDEALGILRYDADYRVRTVRKEYKAHPLVSLRREQFDQVVLNLVSNAVEATAPGGTIHIELEEDATSQLAVLTIEDEGQGMSQEVLERLGEPFFTTRGDRGSGLGVGICMSIVRAHGGSIMYTSEEGVGTTAKVRMPLFAEDGVS